MGGLGCCMQIEVDCTCCIGCGVGRRVGCIDFGTAVFVGWRNCLRREMSHSSSIQPL